METTLKPINWWMNTQNRHWRAYPVNGILFSYKKEWSTDTHSNMDQIFQVFNIKWKKLFIWHVQNRQIYSDKKINSCLGLKGLRENGKWLLMDKEFCCRWAERNEMLSNWLRWWLHNSMNILKITELHILNGWIVWYANYIPMKLLKEKKE